MPDAPKPLGPKKVANFEPPSAIAKFLPYIAVGAVVIALVATMLKAPAYALYAAAVLVSGLVLGLGYVAWGHVHSVAPEDGVRRAVAPVTGLVLVAALGLTGYTLFPPPPAGRVTLGAAGASGEVRVNGPAATVILDAVGTFKPDVGTDAVARYAISISRGREEELVEGTFSRRSGASVPAVGARGVAESTEATASRHVLQTLHGPGTYRVALERIPDSVQLPIHATVRAEPFPQVALWVIWGLLAVIALVVDARIARRNAESAFAASLGVVLGATLYFHTHFTPDTVGTDLIAAVLVGIFGGGIVGEIASRVARKAVG